MMQQLSGSLDDLAIVRRRMRHLARLNIEPKPFVRQTEHGGMGAPSSSQSQERLNHLAWQVLAVQMGHAAPMSALD
jgi:hypothetical protein